MDDHIGNKVTEAVKRVLSVHHDCTELGPGTPLAGGPLRVNETEYVYIILELMNEFSIRFDAADFDHYGLDTIEAMTGCVRRHMER